MLEAETQQRALEMEGDLPESWPRRLHTLVLSRFRLIRLNWSSKWLRGISYGFLKLCGFRPW